MPPYRTEMNGRKYAICRWIRMLGSSFLGSDCGSVMRDATSCSRDEMIARIEIPKPAM